MGGDDIDPEPEVEKPRVKKAKKITFKKAASTVEESQPASAETAKPLDSVEAYRTCTSYGTRR